MVQKSVTKKNISAKPAGKKAAKKAAAPKGRKTAAAKPTRKTKPSAVYRKRFLDEITKELLLMKDRLVRDVTRTFSQETEQANIDVGDFYDQASGDRDRILSLIFSERDRRKLNLIEDALKRIEEGTYGICEMTGEKIGEDRLRVMPFARFTIEAQEEMEKVG